MESSTDAAGAGREDSLWTRPFLLAWVANFLHSTGFHAFLHWPGWLDQRGETEVVIGLLVATMSVAAIVSRPFVGRMMDTRGRRIVMLVGGLRKEVPASIGFEVGFGKDFGCNRFNTTGKRAQREESEQKFFHGTSRAETRLLTAERSALRSRKEKPQERKSRLQSLWEIPCTVSSLVCMLKYPEERTATRP